MKKDDGVTPGSKTGGRMDDDYGVWRRAALQTFFLLPGGTVEPQL